MGGDAKKYASYKIQDLMSFVDVSVFCGCGMLWVFSSSSDLRSIPPVQNMQRNREANLSLNSLIVSCTMGEFVAEKTSSILAAMADGQTTWWREMMLTFYIRWNQYILDSKDR